MTREWPWTGAPATFVLVALLCAVFAVEVAQGAAGNAQALLRLGAFPNSAIIGGEWWRVLTFAFLHLIWWHLLVNVALLAWVGRIVEKPLGSARFAAIYAAGVIVPGAMLLLVRTVRPRPGITVGASGAICALLAAALVLARRRQDRTVRAGLLVCLAVVVGISFLPGVSLMGHATGLVTGGLLASIFSGL